MRQLRYLQSKDDHGLAEGSYNGSIITLKQRLWSLLISMNVLIYISPLVRDDSEVSCRIFFLYSKCYCLLLLLTLLFKALLSQMVPIKSVMSNALLFIESVLNKQNIFDAR